MPNFIIIAWSWFLQNIIGKIKWDFIVAWFNHGKYYKLTYKDLEQFRSLLVLNHYVIVTRRSTHLSTLLLNISEFILRRKWGYWSHNAMNAEDEVTTDDDFRIIEAIGTGVKYSIFMQVFDCDGAALLIPKGFTASMWSAALLDAAQQLGKPYDTVFNFLDDSKISCIELIRHALKKAVPNYETEFKEFETMLTKYRELTPQMLYDCGDFNVALEIRK